MQHPPFLSLLHWLWLAGLMLVGLYITWDTGLLRQMIVTDRTYLSLFILLVFLLASLHCAWISYTLSQEALTLAHWQEQSSTTETPTAANQTTGIHPNSAINQYFQALATPANSERQQLLAEWLGEQLRGQHQIGWFVGATLIKLGLLGTVIGFVIMLGSIGTLESLETSQVQALMEKMTQGMGIALNTTLFGLVSSILLGIQYLLLDRSADRLLAQVIKQTPPVIQAIR